MHEITTSYPLVQGIKKIPGLPTSLLGLSMDGFKQQSIGILHEKLANPEPAFVAAHPDLAPLVGRAEVLAALDTLIRQSNNFDLLIPALVDQILDTETLPLVTPPLHIEKGFRNEILLGGASGLLKLPSKKGAEKIEVIDAENPDIAAVVIPEEEGSEPNSIYYLLINGLRPGKTKILVKVTAENQTHFLLVPVEVHGDVEAEENVALFDAFSKYTVLPELEQKDIAKAVPENQVKTLITIMKALWQGEAKSCSLLTTAIDISPFYQNLILLNIPNLGPDLALEAVRLAVFSSMDKRDFEGDERRMKKYGVHDALIHESSFPLGATWDANRNVAQSTIKYLTVGHVAQIIGINIETFLSSKHHALMEIRSLILHLPGADGEKYLKMPEPETLATGIFVDSVIARSLPDLLSQKLETRSVKVHFPFGDDVENISVAVRNSRGAFITRKKITAAEKAALVFHDLPLSEKVLITAVTQTKTGEKRTHQTAALAANMATEYVFGIDVPR